MIKKTNITVQGNMDQGILFHTFNNLFKAIKTRP